MKILIFAIIVANIIALIIFGVLIGTGTVYAYHPTNPNPPMILPPPSKGNPEGNPKRKPEGKSKDDPKKKPEPKIEPLVIPESRARRRVIKAHNCYPSDTFFAMMMKIKMGLAMAGVEQTPTEVGMVNSGWAQVWIDENKHHYVIASLINQRGNSGYVCILSKGVVPAFNFNVILPAEDGSTIKIKY